MANFFENVEWEVARTLESLSRLSLELRNARDGVLRHYGISHENQLLARLQGGGLTEHPGWEHFLALRILGATREAVRTQMAAGGRGDVSTISPHLALKTFIDKQYGDELATPARLTQDALELALNNGVSLTIHYAAADAYSLRWRAAAADGSVREAGIDTAPLHASLPTQPNHLHCADGRVLADPLTRVGAEPADNLRALLDALRSNPSFALEG